MASLIFRSFPVLESWVVRCSETWRLWRLPLESAPRNFSKTGLAGIISLLAGVFVSFLVGAIVAFAFGYRDAVSLTTIGGGCGHLYRWPGDGNRIRRQLGSDGVECRGWSGKVDSRYDNDAVCGQENWTRDTSIGPHLWWTDGNDQWSRWRTGSHRS